MFTFAFIASAAIIVSDTEKFTLYASYLKMERANKNDVFVIVKYISSGLESFGVAVCA